jgi:hypothetical protein
MELEFAFSATACDVAGDSTAAPGSATAYQHRLRTRRAIGCAD